MIRSQIRIALVLLTAPLLLFASATNAQSTQEPAETQANSEESMHLQYLEIVTTEVDATCDLLAKLHGVTFGDPEAGFGNARIAALQSGGRIGVRAPLAEHEQPVVRPYLLVDDIEAAVAAAEAVGAEIALPATEIPGGHGTFAVYFLGGIQHGFWQHGPPAD